MKDESDRFRVEELVADTRFARALAVGLLRDGAAAEDVLQDAWRAALRSPPRRDRPARPWLTTVVRNLARKRHRDESRRRARESATARPEADPLPGPAELAERLERRRELLRLVGALPEPFCTTILLRFYEGLPAAEIARRAGVPAGTVRWRQARALEILRDRLDERHGDRRAWAVLLVPLAPSSRGPAAGAGFGAAAAAGLAGALAAKHLLVAGALLAAALLALLLADPFGPAPRPDSPTAIAPVDAAGSPPFAAEPTGEDSTRVAAGPPEAGSATTTETTAAVTARLVDPDGRPLPGGRLVAAGGAEPPAAVADDDGRVRLEVRPAGGGEVMVFRAEGDGRVARQVRTTVRPGEETALGDLELAPGGAVRGRVLEPDGRPAAGARVALAKPEKPLDLLVASDAFGPLGADHETVADAAGRWSVPGVPEGWWRVWTGRRGRRWTATEPLMIRAGEVADAGDLTIGGSLEASELAGRVVDGEGRPVPWARVVVWRHAPDAAEPEVLVRTTDEVGRFRVPTGGTLRVDLHAAAPGGGAGPLIREGGAPDAGEVTLPLGPAEERRVEVRDPEGAPVAAFSVDFRETVRRTALLDVDGADGAAVATFPAVPFRVRVRAEGYLATDLGPFAAGGPPAIDVVLTPIAGVSGLVRVGDRPVAGARVVAHLVADPDHNVVHNGYRTRLIPSPLSPTVTDEAGRFRLTPATEGRMLVRVEAPGYAPTESGEFDYDPSRGVRDLVVVPVAGGAVEGRVRVLGDGAAAGAIVAFSRGDGYPFTIRAGRDGTFRAEGLAPGPWLVELAEAEIESGASSTSSGFGRPKPIPFNCEVSPDATATVTLTRDLRVAAVTGRLLLDGRPPGPWSAALHRPGGGLVPLTETDVAPDGTFRLEQPPGSYRLILSSPGRTHEAALVVAEIELAGTLPFECDLETVSWPAPAPPEGEVRYHRFRAAPGVLVLTPLPAAGGGTRVPAGPAEIVRFEIARWNRPAEWPVVDRVDAR